MRTFYRDLHAALRFLAMAVAIAALGASTPSAGSPSQASPATQIPPGLRAEHEAIHAALEEATRAPGRTGEAAAALARVLHPHFERENEIALPPLGALAPLARGEIPSDSAEILKMTAALKQELPGMLEEHERIRAAVRQLESAARAESASSALQLAEGLSAHARMEEEVLYPAAIVVGELLQARMREK